MSAIVGEHLPDLISLKRVSTVAERFLLNLLECAGTRLKRDTEGFDFIKVLSQIFGNVDLKEKRGTRTRILNESRGGSQPCHGMSFLNHQLLIIQTRIN